MQTKKRLLCLERLRRVHRPFGWVDTRLIRENWLAGCSPTAWALYLFWVTVADAQGLSYYADESVSRHLGITPAAVRSGRKELLNAGLLAYDAPLVQILGLDRRSGESMSSDSFRCASALDRAEDAVWIGDILRPMVCGGGQ